MISSKELIAKAEEIAAEEPAYEHGHWGKDGYCDCIGLIIGAIRRAGGQWRGLHGSNYAARREVRKLEKIVSNADLKPGEAVFKAYEPGQGGYSLPERYEKGGEYYDGDLRDYYHVGIVESVYPLRIRHMTTPKPKMDTAIGRWGWHGALKKVAYGEEEKPMGQAEYQARVIGNGLLNMRREPNRESARIMQLAVGSVVTVTDETNDEWRQISYGGHTGYVMAEYLEKDVTLGTYIQVEKKVLEAIYDEIGDMLGLRGRESWNGING